MTQNKNDGGFLFEQKIFSEYTKTSDNSNDDEQIKFSIGEFSPNNPKMRVSTQPFLGLGEYDHRRQLLNDQRKAEYQQYSAQVKRADDEHNAFMKSNFHESRPMAFGQSESVDKAAKLVHYECPDNTELSKQINSKVEAVSIEKVQKETSTGYDKYMENFNAVNSISPKEKLMADLQSQCFPSATGYKPADTVDAERFEKVRKQEKYFEELRQQVEEKKQILKKHKEDEMIEDDLEAGRVETQMRNLECNKREGHGFGRHCYTPDHPDNDQKN